jgi:hypothetical protein
LVVQLTVQPQTYMFTLPQCCTAGALLMSTPARRSLVPAHSRRLLSQT